LRFYGPASGRRFNLRSCCFEDSTDWLDVQPAKFKAYATMLPRLKAEEQLAGLSMAFASEGRMLKDGDQQRLLDQLQARAEGVDLSVRRKEAFSTHALEMMGVKVNMHATGRGGAKPPRRRVRQAAGDGVPSG
jgi:hypothetical protein